jgi:hypothetical protein
MASVIKQRTISAVTENAIQMVNSQFARTLNFGTSWTTMRVGVRMHMSNTGGGLTAAKFAIGFCSGTSNLFGDATTTHFVGAYTTGTWAFQTTFYNATSFAAAKRVGSTLTTGAVLFANGAFPCGAASSTADRAAIFVDITKGSPNYSINLFVANNAVPADMSVASFLSTMEVASPVLGTYTYTSAQTVAVNEGTDGTLDSINISWDHSTPFIEICDVAVARIA